MNFSYYDIKCQENHSKHWFRILPYLLYEFVTNNFLLTPTKNLLQIKHKTYWHKIYIYCFVNLSIYLFIPDTINRKCRVVEKNKGKTKEDANQNIFFMDIIHRDRTIPISMVL